MKVRMIVPISGGRGDGTEWPHPGGILEVDDEEGRHLCQARLAVPVADETGPVTDLDPDMADPTRGGVKPIVNSPKAAWAAYAVSLGADRAEAEAMTKAQLIESYGKNAG